MAQVATTNRCHCHCSNAVCAEGTRNYTPSPSHRCPLRWDTSSSDTITCSLQPFITFYEVIDKIVSMREHDHPLVYDPLLRWHTQGNFLCKLLEIGSAQWRSSYLSNFRRQRRQKTAACGCNTGALIQTLPPSSSSAFGLNSLPSASSNKLPVHRSIV